MNGIRTSTEICPQCNGRGVVPSVQVCSLAKDAVRRSLKAFKEFRIVIWEQWGQSYQQNGRMVHEASVPLFDEEVRHMVLVMHHAFIDASLDSPRAKHFLGLIEMGCPRLLNLKGQWGWAPVGEWDYAIHILEEMHKFLEEQSSALEAQERSPEAPAEDLEANFDIESLYNYLSVRTYNCLKNAGIKNLRELCAWAPEKLLGTKNFGRKSLRELRGILAERGLSMKENGVQQ